MSQPSPFAPTVPGTADFDIGAKYAPPESNVEPVPGLTGQNQAQWFSVSPFKLMVMCTVTLQFYTIYWFYKQWSMVKAREKSSIIPALRAIFAVLFVFPLFNRVRDAGPAGSGLNVAMLACGWVATSLLWKWSDWGWWLGLAAPMFLMPVQGVMNSLNASSGGDTAPNDRFSVLNWIAIVLGGGFLILAFVGMFMPDPT